MMRFLSILLILTILIPAYRPMAKENEEDKGSIKLQRDEILHYNLLPIDFIFINQMSMNELMRSLEKQVEEPAIDATFDENFNIITAKKGKTLNRNEFKARFMETYYNEAAVQFAVPLKDVEPRVDKVLLQDINAKRLGAYTTHYNPNNKERSKNVGLAAEAINGKAIFPGEIFSFNETVGERTEERGYKRAPVIVKGEFAEDIGGGICQVSSTLFNTVDLKGIQMIERYTHSRPVPYVPPGRDATVSWWGPDFSFKNLYNEPVVIRAKAANGSLLIELLSSETVEYFKAKK